MKGAILFGLFLSLIFVGEAKNQDVSREPDNLENIMEYIFNGNDKVQDGTSVTRVHSDQDRKRNQDKETFSRPPAAKTGVTWSPTSPTPPTPHTASKATHVQQSKTTDRTRAPTPVTPPTHHVASVTVSSIPTPPTPHVVTVTSSPAHTDKYLKQIRCLLFAIFIVVTAIFTMLAGRYVFKGVKSLFSPAKEQVYHPLDKKRRPQDFV